MKKLLWLFRRYVLLRYDCPACKQQTMRWHSDNPIHPDGPPLFVWWQCDSCHASSTIQTPLLDQVAPRFGYRSFREMLQKKGYLK